MGQLAQKLPYALVLVRETFDDVPPAHDDPQVRVVYLTDQERETLEAEIVTVRGVLSEAQEDDAGRHLDLVPIKDAGSYADAMSFLHELVPDDGGELLDEDESGVLTDGPEDEEDDDAMDLAMNLDLLGVRARMVGDQIELTRQAVPGSEEHGNLEVREDGLDGLGIDHVSAGGGDGGGFGRVKATGVNGATVYYDERSDEWFPC